MEFYIKQNSTLPILKMEVIKDGRSDYNLNSFLSASTTFLISLYNKSNDTFLFASKECFVTTEYSDFEDKDLYYLNYQFSNKDTLKTGRYEVQISIPSEQGVVLLPLQEKYYVNVVDSFAIKDISFNTEYVASLPCCGTVTEFDYTIIELSSYYNPGSLIILYTLVSNQIFNFDVTSNFTDIVNVYTGTPVSITTGVTITAGQLSGSTSIIIEDVNFNNLDRTNTFKDVIITPQNVGYVINLNSQSIFPTPTPSSTLIPTPSVTPTFTPTPSSTSELTPTPTVTKTSTPTPSITPTQQPEQVITDAIITENVEYISVGGNLYLKFIDPLILEDPILTDDSDFILVGDELYLKYIQPSPVPQPSPSITPTVTPTPSITPSVTPSVTPTITPSPSQEPLYPLTLYIQPLSGGQSIIFEGITYTGETTVNIQLNTFYDIEAVPTPGYMFVGWNIFGGSFSSTGQSTTVAISLTSGANLAPSYAEDPNYDALEAQLTTSLVSYQNATDNDWVSITQEEYSNIFNNVDGVEKIGNTDQQVNTRDLATGYDTTTFGTVDANTPLTIPTGYYVVGFVAESWNQNGQVQLGYTNTYHTGAPTYMGNSPNVIGGMTMFYVRKRPGNVEGAPASVNLYPVLNFLSPAYPNAVSNTYGWFTNDGGATWEQTNPLFTTAKIQILLTNILSWPLPPTPTITPTPTVTPTQTPIICDYFTFTGNNVTTTVNSATKTSAGGWDGAAYSVESYNSSVSVSFQISNDNLYLMGGFSYNPTANPGDTYVNISYGLYIQPNFLEIYENGNQATVIGSMTNTTSDIWKVDYDGVDVKYYKNSTLIYTSSNSVTQPLYIFFPILTEGDGVTNVCVIGTPQPSPTPTPTQTQTQTPTVTPSTCIRNIVVPTLYNGATNINSNLLQLTQTSETLQIQINDTITDFNGSTSFVGNLTSDGTYTYVYTGPGGGVAFNCQFPLTFSGPC